MNNFDVNLNLYRSFYYVAKYGGFTKASKNANISQSSLSSNVKNLEDQLGKKLFKREKVDISLTNYGKDLFLRLEEIKNILDDELINNELKIGCTRFIADNYLADSVSKFKRANNNVKLSFTFANATDMFQMLKKEELDIVVCRYPMFFKFENHVKVEKIADAENIFVCSKKFYEEIYQNNDNFVYPMILPGSSEKRRNIEQYLIDNGINYSVEIEIPNSTLLKKLIINNVGIGYINKRFIEEEVESGTVVIINDFKNIPTDSISIVYNSKNKNNLLIKYIDSLKNTIKNSDN
ncbi:MAG: LysR family transcriptional regulator [Bacilli bacterium]